MELTLKPHDKNNHPLGGIIIKGNTAREWITAIQKMGLSLEKVSVYPIPNTQPDSIWGCFVEYPIPDKKPDIGKNNYCQRVGNLLFIPENARLFPSLSAAEMEKLLGNQKHLLLPEIGLVELRDPLQWDNLIIAPLLIPIDFRQPQPPVFVPKDVKSFLINPVAPEDILEELEGKAFPKREVMEDKPLTAWEKSKLALYRTLFKKNEEKKDGAGAAGGANDAGEQRGEEETGGVETGAFLNALESIRKLFSGKNSNWTERMQKDYEDLEQRNKKALERLLELLQNDPEEALKYAIPLDENGIARGDGMSPFELQKLRSDFSLNWSNMRSGNGSSVLPNDGFKKLQDQYHETAKKLIAEKKYHKAAFVYMKLLKNFLLAAQTLEMSGLYQEATSIYLKYLNNKPKAAECYEKANLILNAIEIYKELPDTDEKVGDLYRSIYKDKEALFYYQKVVNALKSNNQHLKASLLYRNKMNNSLAAQESLLEGWRKGSDAFNCLNNYFAHIPDEKTLAKEIETIYSQEVEAKNREIFLSVIKHEYDKQPNLAARIREIAYEIIVLQLPRNPMLATELSFFNKTDRVLPKDAIRWRLVGKK